LLFKAFQRQAKVFAPSKNREYSFQSATTTQDQRIDPGARKGAGLVLFS
jgi:hypothetical protein